MTVVSGSDLEQGFLSAAGDEPSSQLRREVVRAVVDGLSDNGLRLDIHHRFTPGGAAGTGFAAATRMAAQLCDGAGRLFDAGVAYGGAALVRQLIEVTYLLNVMAHDDAEARRWATADHADIVANFMPGHLRNRSQASFRKAQYESHCDRGGHPNPAGARLLDLRIGGAELEGLWCDLAQHAAEAWEQFCAGLDRFDPRREIGGEFYAPWRSPDQRSTVETAVASWRAQDPLVRLELPIPSS